MLRLFVPQKKMQQHLRDIADRIEKKLANNELEPTRLQCIRSLRELGLQGFGQLLFSMPHENYPCISKLLPKMASEETQISFTGASGEALLKQSIDFLLNVSGNFCSITGDSLKGKRILDFGCGYGRLARLFYYFTDEDRYSCVDPWSKAIELCLADGVTRNVFKSDFIPSSLPLYGDQISNDLIFSFSVFTHLSQEATAACLECLDKYLAHNGVLVITIRPIEFWRATSHLSGRLSEHQIQDLEAKHRKTGFAFFPSGGVEDPTNSYGDTSISIEWILSSVPTTLELKCIDSSPQDPYQIYLFFEKA